MTAPVTSRDSSDASQRRSFAIDSGATHFETSAFGIAGTNTHVIVSLPEAA